ncbi:MAG: 3-methyl-2-oxobutanoate hydroxymethyltransferase, partial [Legionellaceae bacterium]
FKQKKELGKKISMLTCYDYPSARIIADSDIDCVLVGDSVAMVVHGHNTTLMATMEMMRLHTAAVARGLKNQFLISDLPFLSHRMSQEKTIEHVQTLMQSGAHAIKLEGADDDTLNTIAYLVKSGIPIMGHIGLMPQSVHQLGGYRVQGKTQAQALSLLEEAKALEAAGCFALVIECVPAQVAKNITDTLDIPTIGIGSGSDTDGQILVWHDALGLQNDLKPRFVKQFTQADTLLLDAINAYAKEVTNLNFPSAEHAF